MPKALTDAQCLVRAKTEDPDVQKERAEVVKAKSVHELSQITSLGDIPIPFARGSSASAVERKKRFREKYVYARYILCIFPFPPYRTVPYVPA